MSETKILIHPPLDLFVINMWSCNIEIPKTKNQKTQTLSFGVIFVSQGEISWLTLSFFLFHIRDLITGNLRGKKSQKFLTSLEVPGWLCHRLSSALESSPASGSLLGREPASLAPPGLYSLSISPSPLKSLKKFFCTSLDQILDPPQFSLENPLAYSL